MCETILQIHKDCLRSIFEHLSPIPFLYFAVTSRAASKLCEEYVACQYPLLFCQQFWLSRYRTLVVSAAEELYMDWHYKFIYATTCYCSGSHWKVGYNCSCAAYCNMCGRKAPSALLVDIMVCDNVLIRSAYIICRFGCNVKCINKQCENRVNPAIKIRTLCLCPRRIRTDGSSICSECDVKVQDGKVRGFRVCRRVVDGRTIVGVFCRECDVVQGNGSAASGNVEMYSAMTIDPLTHLSYWPTPDTMTPRQIYKYDSLSPFGESKKWYTLHYLFL